MRRTSAFLTQQFSVEMDSAMLVKGVFARKTVVFHQAVAMENAGEMKQFTIAHRTARLLGFVVMGSVFPQKTKTIAHQIVQ